MRYEVRRDYGGKEKETRREYNARFGQPAGPQVKVPPAGEHVWDWFWKLSGRRQHSESGPLPIGYAEIGAWSQLLDIHTYPDEIETLTKMDEAFMAETSAEMEAVRRRQAAGKPAPKRYK